LALLPSAMARNPVQRTDRGAVSSDRGPVVRPAAEWPHVMHTPAIGDWINSYSPGVWHVYRLLEGFNGVRYSLDARKKRSKRVIVFSKRLADATWKPAFRTESCERSLVTPLSPEVRRRVDDLLSADPGIRSAFNAYQPESIPLIVNLTMNVSDRGRL